MQNVANQINKEKPSEKRGKRDRIQKLCFIKSQT